VTNNNDVAGRTVAGRRFLQCMVWVSIGALGTLCGSDLRSMPIAHAAARPSAHDASRGRVPSPEITEVPLTDDQQTAAAGFSVIVDNFTFAPATTIVPVGTTVTWTNRDDLPHNVVSVEQKFKSPVLDTDEKFSHRFDTAGSYKYFCSIHPKMTGEIVVR
jgi:plastocyanin